jgi:hypothetical protein
MQHDRRFAEIWLLHDTHADLLSEKNIVRSLKSIINEQLHTASTND